MAGVKEGLRDVSLGRFYAVTAVSSVYCLGQLAVAHFAHSLILQIDAYHMLYNILSLVICIVTVKLCRKGTSLKNTFGWTRLDVCGDVSNLVFLAALCFSLIVEAIQTLIHLGHHEKMHAPIPVAILGGIGLLVNAFTFYAIGGYTFHQSSFLGSSHVGDEVVISASVQAYVKRGVKTRRRQGIVETFRDSFGAVLVIICSLLVLYFDEGKPHAFSDHFEDKEIGVNGSAVNGSDMDSGGKNTFSDYLDPLLTIFSITVLVSLSYSYAKEAAHILLLTIPEHINVKSLVDELLKTFPEILDIHDFHVWQLTSERIVASAHIVLQETTGYLATHNNIVDFLHTKAISHITLQPEFMQLGSSEGSPVRRVKCFLPCEDEDCREKQCCEDDPPPVCPLTILSTDDGSDENEELEPMI